MFLLDTHVVSELRKARAGKADAHVVSWAESVNPSDLWLSAISVLELEIGVLRIERRDASQGTLLRKWLTTRVLPSFTDRILPVDEAVALRCARLHVPDPATDRDSMIAATALVHGLRVVTRNTSDFAPLETKTINPWLDGN